MNCMQRPRSEWLFRCKPLDSENQPPVTQKPNVHDRNPGYYQEDDYDEPDEERYSDNRQR